MKFWIMIFGGLYAVMLIIASFKSYKKGRSAEDFMLAGSNVGMFLGLLTFAAALFSTFTFLGMPDFFRLHGIGAWIFLAVSDGVMVFFIIWFGYHIRKKVKEKGFKQISDPAEIEAIVKKIFDANESQVNDYIGGNQRLHGFFVGQVMKATQGSANPQLVNEVIAKLAAEKKQN